MTKFKYQDTNAEIKVGDVFFTLSPYDKKYVVVKITEKCLVAQSYATISNNTFFDNSYGIFTSRSNAIIGKYIKTEKQKQDLINALDNKTF